MMKTRLKAQDSVRRHGSLVTLVTIFASLFVAKRLWDQHVELTKLRALTHGDGRLGRMGEGQEGGYTNRKSRVGDAGLGSSGLGEGQTTQDDVECGRRTHRPLFYSVRPKPKEVVTEVRGINVELPAKKDIASYPLAGASVASIDAVQRGHVTGWACHRSSEGLTRSSAHIYAIVDNTVVASVDVTELYLRQDVPKEIVEICDASEDSNAGSASTTGDRSAGGSDPRVFKFDIDLPPLPQGVHELRVLIEDASAGAHSGSVEPVKLDDPLGGSSPAELDGPRTSLVEAFHSPLDFEESANEISMAAIIKRKDEIITHRNNLLTKLWNEVHTQLPWKRYEVDALEIPVDLNGEGANAPDLLAFIIVRSDAVRQERRDAIRRTWGKTLRQSNMMAKFFVETQFSGPHKGMLDKEMKRSDDVVPIALGPDKSEEIDRVLYTLHHAVKHHDASFYFVVSDGMLVLPQNLQKYLDKTLSKGNMYMGCMKSGGIVTEDDKAWYEPEHWRFGDGKEKTYPQHAKSAMFGFSRLVARHLARSKEVLHRYANTDTTIGTWMLGLNVEYDDNSDFCSDWRSCSSTHKPMGVKDPACDGICQPQDMDGAWKNCAQN